MQRELNLAVFVEQAEYIQPEDFGKWGVAHPQENAIIKKLISPGAKLITGPRGCGKTRRIPSLWVFNDFGPIAIRWFKDTNGNKVLDKNEKLSGQMFHTTPQNETEVSLGKPVQLSPSHGCIHLNPRDRDIIMGLGGFKPKTTFVVRKYNEKI